MFTISLAKKVIQKSKQEIQRGDRSLSFSGSSGHIQGRDKLLPDLSQCILVFRGVRRLLLPFGCGHYLRLMPALVGFAGQEAHLRDIVHLEDADVSAGLLVHIRPETDDYELRVQGAVLKQPKKAGAGGSTFKPANKKTNKKCTPPSTPIPYFDVFSDDSDIAIV